MASSLPGVDQDDFQKRFCGDSQIKRSGMRERELKAWSGDSEGMGTSEGLEGHRITEKAKWDQFKANEEKFGVKTTFDENLYTTRLDKSSSFYKERSQEAERLSREILGEECTNIHLAEERGHAVCEDEEEKYGAIMKDTNVYIPPAFRRQTQSDCSNTLVETNLDNTVCSIDLPASTTPVRSEMKTEMKEVGESSESKPEKTKLNLNAPEFIPGKFKVYHTPTSTAASSPLMTPQAYTYPFYVPTYTGDPEYAFSSPNGLGLSPHIDGATYLNPYTRYYGPSQTTPQSPLYENVYYHKQRGQYPPGTRKQGGK